MLLNSDGNSNIEPTRKFPFVLWGNLGEIRSVRENINCPNIWSIMEKSAMAFTVTEGCAV